MTKKNVLIILLLLCTGHIFAQQDSTITKQDTATAKKDSAAGFGSKAEKFFKIFPVPIYSYSSDAGNTFGLAKFNLFQLKKSDTISKPSKLSEVLTFSTKGRINASVTTELVWNEDKNVVLSYINYRKQPEYIFGIGNDVVKDSVEQVQFDRIKFFSTGLRKVRKNFFIGIPLDLAGYFDIQPDSGSFLYGKPPARDTVTGVDGGFTIGTGIAAAYDSRDSRYNTFKGMYILAILIAHPEWLGSAYNFTQFQLDVRKFFNPWKRHVIALQATTSAASGNTPFYELSQLGGDAQMRGYYKGAYRDKILVDAQFEYRMPVWKIFGITGWVGTGRVAPSYGNLSWDGWKFSFGGGFRVQVDKKNRTNMRVDFGFGPNGISGTYINFAEAF